MARPDPHSYFDDTQPAVEHVAWSARVDFAARVLHAEATLRLDRPGDGPLDLDTRDLDIGAVTDGGGRALEFTLDAPDAVLGCRLRVQLPTGTTHVQVAYATRPEASALQWLEPAQTSGAHPFLFSQCQAIHARSVLPLQDTPAVRIRFEAHVVVPRALRVLMAARFVARAENRTEAVETWTMPEPIPPYLFAFAVGDLTSRELGPRSRVWAEPAWAERAAAEFVEVDAMLTAAEKLFGPYAWERFDILSMPASFPYGGMENPRLTFLTPTLLAGDRSLVNVVAHELAHAWTGNLVTNANAEHFWLNEGFTVFAERRIVEALYGADVANLDAALGRRELDRAVAGFAEQPDLTRLRTHLAGIDPDEAFSVVPYEKGYLFLRALEDAVGRPAFDAFLRTYIERFRFASLTTETFVAFTEAQLPGALARVDSDAWLHGPGVPANAPAAQSTRLSALEAVGHGLPSAALAGQWRTNEWCLYLERVRGHLDVEACRALDVAFSLSKRENAEIRTAYYEVCLTAGRADVWPDVEAFLSRVGRMKYLKPLYAALAATPAGHARAVSLFERIGPTYHPIARQVITGLLKRSAAAHA